MTTEKDDFDYIIVGGGTAGCVLANRLTEDGRRRVLVLEAGGKDDGFWIRIPAGFSKLLTGHQYNWRFTTEPEESVLGRTIVVPRGKGLGGSSLINGMIFVRGQPEDYNQWAQMGNRGWGFSDILPYFKKLERFEDANSALRGSCGPLDIVRVSLRDILPDAFIDAGQELGYPFNPDYNAADQLGFGYYQVNQRNGRRLSAADAYLRPAERRRNLDVRTGCHVSRIQLDDQHRARAVIYRQHGKELRATARGEIILCTGAVQSPHLLELSGVGDPRVLGAAGIAVERNLPGVGSNYSDHFATRMNWRVQGARTLNETTRGWHLTKAVIQYYAMRRGSLSLGTGLAFGFVKTLAEAKAPDVQFFFMHASYADASDRKLDRHPGMTIGVTQLRPQSRGTIHLSSPDPATPPAIRPNFLSAEEDRRAIVGGMRIARQVMEQSAIARYCARELNPGEAIADDKDFLAFARNNGQSIYHAAGTCAMGPRASRGAVVDERLRVHTTTGLRVVDASVMPTMVSGNTAAAVIMIAEKAADMIREDAYAV